MRMLRLLTELDAYWPEYLAHHSHRGNRELHALADVVVLAGATTMNPFVLAAGIATGYALAFAGHCVVEGNRPATLDRPLLAGLSNWRMFYLALRGRLDDEYRRHGIEQRGESFGAEAWRRLLGMSSAS
jgi:hypothetical protein